MKDKVLYFICFGFIFGVLLRSFISIDFYFSLLFFGISFTIFLFFIFVSKNRFGILFSIFLLSFTLGVFRFSTADTLPPESFESRVGNKVELSGLIITAPEFRENSQKLTVEAVEIGEKTKILATVGFDQEFKYGDEVSVLGTLDKPENFVTDQGKDFDYINYLRKDGIFYLINYAEVEVLSRGNGSVVKRVLFSIKDAFLEKINFVIRSPENLLLAGLILGERSAFSQELRQDFIDTGTIHIVALSGYNVTIVAEWIMKAFYFLPLMWSFGAGIFGILLFVIMAGGQATAVRAGAMSILALVARATGRGYDVARALILVAVVMIISNPFVLVFDVSFQLSFIATIAVIFFAPRVEKYFLWVPKRFGLRDIVAVTSAVYVFVLPFILYKMGNLSIVALPANVLILPVIPLIMFLGFLTGFLGIVYYVLSVPAGYLAYQLLKYQLWVVEVLADFSFASFTIPNFPLWLVLVIYFGFVYYLFGKSIKSFFYDSPV